MEEERERTHTLIKRLTKILTLGLAAAAGRDILRIAIGDSLWVAIDHSGAAHDAARRLARALLLDFGLQGRVALVQWLRDLQDELPGLAANIPNLITEVESYNDFEAEKRALNRAHFASERSLAQASEIGKVQASSFQFKFLQVPPLDGSFYGREAELAFINHALSPKTYSGSAAHAAARCAVEGLAGIGKSRLVLEYAYRHAEDFEQVLWIDAAGEDLTAAWADFAGKLALPTAKHPDVQIRADGLTEYLQDGRRRLLILDNVTSDCAVFDRLPKHGQTAILITTRRISSLVPAENRKILRALHPEDGLRILRGTHPLKPPEEDACRQLYEAFGGLTLALTVAGRVFPRSFTTPSQH